MSKTPMHNSEAMSNHVRELTNQANELTVDELDAVVGGTMAYVPHTYAIGRIEARFPRV